MALGPVGLIARAFAHSVAILFHDHIKSFGEYVLDKVIGIKSLFSRLFGSKNEEKNLENDEMEEKPM